jgi:hypothetical protein
MFVLASVSVAHGPSAVPSSRSSRHLPSVDAIQELVGGHTGKDTQLLNWIGTVGNASGAQSAGQRVRYKDGVPIVPNAAPPMSTPLKRQPPPQPRSAHARSSTAGHQREQRWAQRKRASESRARKWVEAEEAASVGGVHLPYSGPHALYRRTLRIGYCNMTQPMYAPLHGLGHMNIHLFRFIPRAEFVACVARANPSRVAHRRIVLGISLQVRRRVEAVAGWHAPRPTPHPSVLNLVELAMSMPRAKPAEHEVGTSRLVPGTSPTACATRRSRAPTLSASRR